MSNEQKVSNSDVCIRPLSGGGQGVGRHVFDNNDSCVYCGATNTNGDVERCVDCKHADSRVRGVCRCGHRCTFPVATTEATYRTVEQLDGSVATFADITIEAANQDSNAAQNSSGRVGDPTRFLDRSFTWIENKGRNIRLLDRDEYRDPQRGISISWDDLPALRELITLALEDGPMVIGPDTRSSDASKISELEQLVCDFQAASMLGTPDDPAGVTPAMLERYITELRADASGYVRGLESAASANCEFCQRVDYPKAALYGDAWAHRDEKHAAWCESQAIRGLISQHSPEVKRK